MVKWGPGQPRRLASDNAWHQPVLWNKRARLAGTRYRVLTDLCDVFDDWGEQSHHWRNIFLFELVAGTPNLDWLVLTKRIAKAARWLGNDSAKILPTNVWLGASVCTQPEADEKIPILLSIPATKHWVSVEPMLGPVDIARLIGSNKKCGCGGLCDSGEPCPMAYNWHSPIDWVICGGETGPGARPMHPDWARSLRDQCQAAGVPFWFKSHGEWLPTQAPDELDWKKLGYFQGSNWFRMTSKREAADHIEDWFSNKNDDRQWMLRIGHKLAGNLLDGRKWEEVLE